MRVTILRRPGGHGDYAELVEALPDECVDFKGKLCTVTVTEASAPILWRYYKERSNHPLRQLMAAWMVSRGMPCEDEAEVAAPVAIRFKPPVREDDAAAFAAIRHLVAHTITSWSAAACNLTVADPQAALLLWKFCRRACHSPSASRLYVYLLAHGCDAFCSGVTWDSHISELDIAMKTRLACEQHGINTLRDFAGLRSRLKPFEAEEVEQALSEHPSLNEP